MLKAKEEKNIFPHLSASLVGVMVDGMEDVERKVKSA